MTALSRRARWRTTPLAVGVLAFAVRLVAAIASFVVNHRFLIPDEQQYISLASVVASGKSADSWAPGYGQTLYDSTAAFIVPLRLLFDIFGPNRLAGQLLAVCFGAVTAGLTVWLARRLVTKRYAVAAGLLVALLPSQILFSSVALRESMVWSSVAVAAVALVVLSSGGRRNVALGAALLGVALLALGALRDQTQVIVAWAAVLAALVSQRPGRLTRTSLVLGLAVIVPVLGGAGLAGSGLVSRSSGELGQLRTYGALNANSGFVPTTATTVPGAGGVQAPRTLRDKATRVPGSNQKLIRSGSGVVYVVDDSLRANVSELPRGLLAVLLRPFPGSTGSSQTVLAGMEDIGWYLLYTLVAVGAVTAGWSRREVLAFPIIVSGGLLLASALSQGNLGTAFRHRQQMLWAAAVLAAAGAQWLVERRRRAQLTASPATAR